jgi:hypothetical protein
MIWFLFPGCNPEISFVSPNDLFCSKYDEAETFEVDGFLFCGADLKKKVPVDDPIYWDCHKVRADTDGEVLSLFDGVHARAWPIEALHKREIVNDDFFGEPIAVDY